MANTTNYSLPLPQLGEPADIRVLDQGTEMIDGIMHGNRTMIAPGWVSTETYNTGNRVVYLGEYYKCKADNVTGAWDATKWDKTTVGEDIEGLGTGGASALADLDDVEITSPTEGQALLYDDEDDKWKNGTLPDPSVVKEVTGNPIEITDAASAPLVKCVTDITGSQDLHGYDKPWVGGAGKNKYGITLSELKNINQTGTWANNVYTWNDVSWTVHVGNNGYVDYITADGLATATSNMLLISTTTHNEYLGMVINGCPSNGAANKYQITGWNQTDSVGIGVRDTGNGLTIPNNLQDKQYRLYCSVNNGYNAQNLVFRPMIRLSTVTDSTFTPYSNICPITAYTEGEIEVSDGDGNTTTHTTTYPSAIYRGSEDCVKGEATSDMLCDDLGDFTWTKASGFSNKDVFYTPLSSLSGVPKHVIYQVPNAISSVAIATYQQAPVWEIGTFVFVGIEGVLPANNLGFIVPLGAYSDATAFKTAMTGQKIAYEIATPTTSSVTPTNLPIRTLSGYTHIESSTGEMEVEYISGNYQALVDLIQSSSHVYSTAEQVVGKWTDGKDIYEKTFELQSEVTLTANQWNSITGVSLSGVETPIDAEIRGSSGTSVANVDFMDSPVSVWGTSGTEKVKSITFRYTKSTSNRSLSAPVNTQKAQIEPLTDKTEEVPTEEEKAVETPVEKPETEEENDER